MQTMMMKIEGEKLMVFYEGTWRQVHSQLKRPSFIYVNGRKVDIDIGDTPVPVRDPVVKKPSTFDYGFLHHGSGNEPRLTERVRVKNEYADKWLAHYDGCWRRVYLGLHQHHIRYQGKRIPIQIDGV